MRRRNDRGEGSAAPAGVGRRRTQNAARPRAGAEPRAASPRASGGAPRSPASGKREAAEAKAEGAASTGAASERRAGAPRRTERPPKPAKARPAPSAEEMLRRALLASTPRSRALWARRGLSLRGPLDRGTQAMLLRQLYLAYYEEQRFERAIEVAEQTVALGVLPDVAHQDAARAMQARGDIEGALGHLRLAARTGPPSRRAFHLWTLGSVCHLAGRQDEAIGALSRAARWGTTDKPLYLGHLAVVRCERGEDVPDLGALMDRLAEAPSGQGYGRFVLGQLAFHARRWDEARQHLEAFIRRSTSGRPAQAIALGGEIARARETLAAISRP